MLGKFSKKAALLALPLLAPVAHAAPRLRLESRGSDFDYNHQTVRGVNTGGWLLTEPWITPSLYDAAPDAAVDEWTFCATLGKDEAKARLSDHWDTFYTQGDFQRMADAGLTHVRIPIGYWAVHMVDDEPYVAGQIEYMDKAISWARDVGLKVIVDLHGAPGSQNGFDNSGRRGPIRWQEGDTVAQTVIAFDRLAHRYAKETDVVDAIEALNEPFVPAGVSLGGLKEYYHSAWKKLRQYDNDTTLILSDGFLHPDTWNGFMSGRNRFVMMDTHHYQVFDAGLLAMDINAHVDTVCQLGHNHLRKADKWTIVGEWSGALTDCAKYLNGKGLGARYDGTYGSGGGGKMGSCAGKRQGSVAALPADDKAHIRQFIEAQLNVFEKVNGWVFWTWKTEGAPEWDMQQLLAEGVFPSPLTDRKFGTQC